MDAYPAVSARLYLTNRSVKLIDEGIDIALRIGHLPDSASVAIRVGEVRRVGRPRPVTGRGVHALSNRVIWSNTRSLQ
jgi:DNA-binding transcriptional LysR family regulator